MIDVPVLVKDALRDGRRLKNYRFTVQRSVRTRSISNIAIINNSANSYTIGYDAVIYFHIAASEPTCTIQGSVTLPNQAGHESFIIDHEEGKELLGAIGQYPIGSVVRFAVTGGVLPTIGLTKEDLITYSTSWVNDFTINNDTLVTESVKFDERMCSGNQLKFGLSEGSSLEFQYFDHPSIKGCRVYSEIDVQYKNGGSLSWYTIPMGFYTVSQCPMQYSTGIYKVTAYNKLKSEYLDAKANAYIEDMLPDTFANQDDISIRTIMDLLLQEYEIKRLKDEVTIDLRVDGAMLYDWWSDWTFKFVGENTTRTAGFVFSKSLQPDGNNVPSLFAGLRLEFDVKKYMQVLEEIFADFRTYVYAYIQDPDDFMAKFRTHVVRALSLMVDPQGSYARTYYTLDELVPDNNQAVDAYSDTRYVYSLSKLHYLNNVRYFAFQLLAGFGYYSSGSVTQTWQYYTDFTIYNRPHIYSETVDDISLITVNKNKLADVTLRDIISANYELRCQYGKLDRETDLFAGVGLNNQWLFPAEDLYPANNLYPGGGGLTSSSAFRSTYSKLWTDQAGEQSFRNLIITYKGLDENDRETDYQVVFEVNDDGTTDYVMTDNWIFKNLVWSYPDIESLAAGMVSKLRGVHWFPFEMWCAGLPYIETGDEIEIILGQNTFTTYVLQRQLSGIQNLQDTYINGTLEIF